MDSWFKLLCCFLGICEAPLPEVTVALRWHASTPEKRGSDGVQPDPTWENIVTRLTVDHTRGYYTLNTHDKLKL